MMAHGDAWEGKWGENWRMEWIASTLNTTSEHGADAHASVASSQLNWRPCWFKWTRPFRRKTKYCFCACAITFKLASSSIGLTNTWRCYVQFWAPDDGRKNRLEHVERLPEINKLRNVASCWLYAANMLAMHGHTNVKNISGCFIIIIIIIYLFFWKIEMVTVFIIFGRRSLWIRSSVTSEVKIKGNIVQH